MPIANGESRLEPEREPALRIVEIRDGGEVCDGNLARGLPAGAAVDPLGRTRSTRQAAATGQSAEVRRSRLPCPRLRASHRRARPRRPRHILPRAGCPRWEMRPLAASVQSGAARRRTPQTSAARRSGLCKSVRGASVAAVIVGRVPLTKAWAERECSSSPPR